MCKDCCWQSMDEFEENLCYYRHDPKKYGECGDKLIIVEEYLLEDGDYYNDYACNKHEALYLEQLKKGFLK